MSDRLLRLALLALPRDGEVMLDCAREMVDAGASAPAEAAGIVAAGARARVIRAAGPAVHAPWGTALDRLAVPLASAALLLFAAGAGMTAGTGRWTPTMVAAAVTALAGAVLRLRNVAVVGWAVLLAADLYAVLGSSILDRGGRFSGSIGSLGVDVPAAALPLLALGLASACALRSDGPRRIVVATIAVAAAAALAGLVFDAATTPWQDPHAITTGLLVLLLLAPPAAVLAALVTRRAEAMAAAALLLAVAAPELVWLSTGLLPYPGATGALAVLAAGGALAAVLVRALARSAGHGAR